MEGINKIELTGGREVMEIALALLQDDIEGAEEIGDQYWLYYQKSKERNLIEICTNLGITIGKIEAIEQKHWNTEWEKSIQPISLGDFCHIRASFHQTPESEFVHEIIITPKMAFGTGHHQTTRLMIGMMRDLAISGKVVLDYGAGTGILAILADKMGATLTDALEIDPEAIVNLLENVKYNRSNVNVMEGDISEVSENQYDIILANINRNVIMERISDIGKILRGNGIVISSGYLYPDVEEITIKFSDIGCKEIEASREGEWHCQAFLKIR